MNLINLTFEGLKALFDHTNGYNQMVIGFLLLEVLSLTTSIMAIIYQNKLKKNDILKEVFKHFQILVIIIFGKTIDIFIMVVSRILCKLFGFSFHKLCCRIDFLIRIQTY